MKILFYCSLKINKNPINDFEKYDKFYEILGKHYPETELVHADRSETSRYRAVLSFLKPYALKGKKLLDIGCNDGVYTIPYCELGGNAIGMDISESLIKKARKKAKNLDVQFLKNDIQQSIELEKNSFDIILFSEVFEHLIDKDKAILNIIQALKSNGILILTTPTPVFEIESKFNIKRIFNTIFTNKFEKKQILDTSNSRIAEYDLKGFSYIHNAYYPRGLKKYLESFNFKILKHYTIDFKYDKIEFMFRKLPWVKLLGRFNIIIAQKK